MRWSLDPLFKIFRGTDGYQEATVGLMFVVNVFFHFFIEGLKTNVSQSHTIVKMSEAYLETSLGRF